MSPLQSLLPATLLCLHWLAAHAVRSSMVLDVDEVKTTELFEERIASCTTTVWKGAFDEAQGNLDALKDKFLKQVNDRAEDPVKIRQFKQFLCGPVAFLYALAFAQPELYKELASALFCEGKFTKVNSKGETISIDVTEEKIMGESVIGIEHPACKAEGEKCISLADWVTAGGIRHASNYLLGAGEQGSLGQLTTPNEMSAWLGLLDATMTSYGGLSRVILGGSMGKGTMGKITSAVENGKGQVMALLLIDPSCKNWVPSHWVVLHSVIKRGDEVYCYSKTWGRYKSDICSELCIYTAYVLDFGTDEKKIPEERIKAVLGKHYLT